MFVAVKPSKLDGEITSAREGSIMVANHPGMSDQTNSNIARDGAAKRPQTKFPITPGMKNQTEASRLSASPDHPGFGPDADPAGPNVKMPLGKRIAEPHASWGMKDANGQSVNGNLGKAVLAEAANLGR